MGATKTSSKASTRRSGSAFSLDYSCTVSVQKAKGRSTDQGDVNVQRGRCKKGTE